LQRLRQTWALERHFAERVDLGERAGLGTRRHVRGSARIHAFGNRLHESDAERDGRCRAEGIWLRSHDGERRGSRGPVW